MAQTNSLQEGDHCPYCGQKIPKGEYEVIWRKIHFKEHQIETEEANKINNIKKDLEKQSEQKQARAEESIRREADTRWKKRLEITTQTIRRLNEEKERAKKREKEMREKHAKELRFRIKAEKEISFAKGSSQERKKTEKLNQSYVALSRKLAKANDEKNKLYQKGKEEGRLENLKENNALRSKLSEMERKLEHLPSEERGSKTEEEMLSSLKRSFPEDEFERVMKGKEGCDIIQKVRLREKVCGSIVYEIKNVKNWLNKFITRAKEYRNIYKTKHVLIVTTAFPRNEEHFCSKDGISIVSPSHFLFIAEIIRNGIIDLEKQKLTEVEKEFKMQLLYEYLSGEEFKEKMLGIGEYVRILEEILSKEEDYHQKKWQQETETQRKIRENAVKVEAKIENLLMTSPSTATSRIVRRSKT